MSNRPAPADLDFRKLVHAGDLVVWGQGCAEPRGLTEAILAQRASLGGIRCMIGVPAPQTSVRAEHADHVAFLSYTGSGVNRALHQRGALDILPSHYSQLPRVFTRGARAADVVVLLQVPPPDASGHYSLGLANEYLSSAIDHARTVIVEVNESVPRTGGRLLDPDAVDVVTHSELAPSAMPIAEPGPCEQLIARHVAQLIDDGSTLQIGLGAVPEAVLAELSDHRGLGVHSGLLSDGMMKLMQCGAIDNSRKGIDVGISVGGVVMGSTELIEFADSNPAIEVRETEYTHSSDVIAGLHKFVSINSAIEVDLSGQVNAEVARGRYVGAVGGAVDFARGAQRCADGLAIIALPSTANGASRIVSDLSGPVSTSRSDVSIVVTEYGVADLRGRTIRQRHEQMLAIAHPDHREHLDRYRVRHLGTSDWKGSSSK